MKRFRFLFVLLPVLLLRVDATEMLINPKFADGLEPWQFARAAEYNGKIQKPSIAPAGGTRKMPECVIQIPHASSWHYVRIQQPVEIVNGETYRISLEAKYREAPGDLRVATWSQGIQKNNGLSAPMTLTPNWQRFEVSFKARNVDESEIPQFLVGAGAMKGTVFVRNVSFEQFSDTTIKPNVVKTSAIEGEANRPAIKTVDADAQQIIDDFAEDINGAKRKYAGRNLALSAAVTGVDKGQRPGTYVLALLDGGIRITVGGRDFNEDAYDRLNGSIRRIRSQIKDDQKTRKGFWDKLDRTEKEQAEYKFYPSLNCIARIHNYRNRTVEIQQTMDLLISYPSN